MSQILQQMLQDFKSVSHHFGRLCIKGLISLGSTLKSLIQSNSSLSFSISFFLSDVDYEIRI